MAQEYGCDLGINEVMDRSTHIAVIGAGPVGLAVAKALRNHQILYEQLEADDDLGGNWYHGVYETARLISSKRTTEYPDFPMPRDYPDFPSAGQMIDYLRSYAAAFNLRPQIQFRSKVLMCLPLVDGRWELELESGEKRVYKGVIVCNGHHWDKRYPDYPGTFSGEYFHSKDYKQPSQLVGKRVLVIGGGNSACDIASEAARVGKTCGLSLRRGYWFLPKTTLGIPLANLAPGWTPVWTQQLVLKILVRLMFGRYESYGLPKPNHRIFDAHPTVNTDILNYIKRGRIQPRPEITRFEDQRVFFGDGTSDKFDTVVCATGFHLSFPFLPPGLVPVKASNALLYGGCTLPDFKNIYIVGTAQPRYGFGPLMTPAADLICKFIEMQDQMELPIGQVLKEVGAQPLRTHLVDPYVALRQMKRIRRLLPQLPREERKYRQRLKQRTPALARLDLEYERPNPQLRVY